MEKIIHTISTLQSAMRSVEVSADIHKIAARSWIYDDSSIVVEVVAEEIWNEGELMDTVLYGLYNSRNISEDELKSNLS